MKNHFRNIRRASYTFTIICQAFAFALSLTACANLSHSGIDNQPRDLTPYETEFISHEYGLIYRVKELPNAIIELLDHRLPGIADPGEPFNSTDLIVPELPFTQLTWAGISDDFGFVLYKQGGFAPHQRLLLIKLNMDQILETSEFIIPYYISDVATLKRYILSGKATMQKEAK